MSKLPDKYDAKIIENKWRHDWQKNKIYQWQNDLPKNQTFVIDTPPPTVSGLLHMGHVFSYTQADFVARYNRMSGKDVFYPMGFDDNGLPTERLVEKIIGKKAGIYENENGRGSFVAKCREVVDEAEKEFEILFNEIALSVDWEQKYQTISPESQKISQASFVDLLNKGLVEKQNQPVFWDISDRTALAQADIIDKEVEGEMYFFDFAIQGNANNLEIMTTRPELLPACVAVMINGQDERYQNLILDKDKFANQGGEGQTGSFAITPIFGVKVPIIADNSVQLDKGTGVVMCCTFGDETDLKWWRKYELPLREIINDDGTIKNLINVEDDEKHKKLFGNYAIICPINALFLIEKEMILDPKFFIENYQKISNQKIKEAKKIIVELLSNSSVFNSPLERESKSPSDFGGGSNNIFKSQKITRPVKCAERSGVPIEIISKPQWFIKILDKKEQLKEQAKKCNWYPEYMCVRIEQWIDGLSWDWCISRQRFFGVKFPMWDLESFNPEDSTQVKWGEEYSYDPHLASKSITADISQLPVDPEIDIPLGFTLVDKSEIESAKTKFYTDKNYTFNENNFNKKVVKDSDGKLWFITPETDIMDTWATSSISPQLSSKGISDEIYFDEKSRARHQKLFPADMRPQAHEIIRTWAFYTITKAYLHSLNRVKNADGTFAKNVDGSIKLQENINDEISLPWKNLMISGWCLASDKTKMSKSKGNVVTPTALIQEKSADVVRYWASASNLGADIAYSEDVFKIGQKLITKLFNSAKFCSQHFAVLEEYFNESATKNSVKNHDEKLSQLVTETTDIWILSRLKKVIENYQKQFEIFEYARAREVVEEFFWKDFCDNYLEICKVRSYGLSAEKLAGVELNQMQKQQIIAKQLSSIATLSLCLKNILKLLAPFIPHITEEIYATIFHDEFVQKKSIHARGNCAKLPENLAIINQENIEKIGEELLAIIFEVRKFKSEKNLSMKVPIAILEIASKLDLSSVNEDLLNVTNSQKIEFNESENLVKVIIS